MAASGLTNAQKGLLGVGGLGLSVWYAYYRKTRPILPDSLIPDEDRKEAIPPQELSSWFYGKYEEEFAKAYMTDVYSYLIAKSFKILKINSNASKLKILDCGCGTGGLSFQLLQKQGDKIDEVYGVDLSPESIKIANEKLKSSGHKNKSKLQFKCKDATVLNEFTDNYFDIGYCSLVLHDMPHRVPMNILCELSRV